MTIVSNSLPQFSLCFYQFYNQGVLFVTKSFLNIHR